MWSYFTGLGKKMFLELFKNNLGAFIETISPDQVTTLYIFFFFFFFF
jgi:hypothetical protein